MAARSRCIRNEASLALRCASEDIEALVVSTRHGPFPVAGIPNFVCTFGRDALIMSLRLPSAAPSLAAAALRFLTAYQGTRDDPVREEETGKIAHEIPVGELARCGDAPSARFYGTRQT